VGGTLVLNIPFIVETRYIEYVQGTIKKQMTGIYKMSMTRNTLIHNGEFKIDVGSQASLYPVNIQPDQP
jgi:hypothetical protein